MSNPQRGILRAVSTTRPWPGPICRHTMLTRSSRWCRTTLRCLQ